MARHLTTCEDFSFAGRNYQLQIHVFIGSFSWKILKEYEWLVSLDHLLWFGLGKKWLATLRTSDDSKKGESQGGFASQRRVHGRMPQSTIVWAADPVIQVETSSIPIYGDDRTNMNSWYSDVKQGSYFSRSATWVQEHFISWQHFEMRRRTEMDPLNFEIPNSPRSGVFTFHHPWLLLHPKHHGLQRLALCFGARFRLHSVDDLAMKRRDKRLKTFSTWSKWRMAPPCPGLCGRWPRAFHSTCSDHLTFHESNKFNLPTSTNIYQDTALSDRSFSSCPKMNAFAPNISKLTVFGNNTDSFGRRWHTISAEGGTEGDEELTRIRVFTSTNGGTVVVACDTGNCIWQPCIVTTLCCWRKDLWCVIDLEPRIAHYSKSKCSWAYSCEIK